MSTVAATLVSALLSTVAAVLFPCATAAAMGLGAASLNSGLGEPLRLSFPVSLQPNEEVGCVQVRSKGDDLPGVLNTRSSVIRNGFQTRIEVTSAKPVNEPAIGIVVSVGCASPIAREYVLFLDPPIVQPTESLPPLQRETVVNRSTLPPIGLRRGSTRRQASSGVAGKSQADARAPTPARSVRARARPAPIVADAAPRHSRSATLAKPVQPPAARNGDRLTVAPTEPSQVPATSPSGTAASALAGTAAALSPGTAPQASPASGAVRGDLATVADDGAGSVVRPPVVEAPDREQAMRQQQADLQKQIQSLGEQIAVLRVQTTSLATRNRLLETSTLSPLLIWLLIALATVAIIVAGWMAWRYMQLRRSIGDAAWWAGNTAHVAAVPAGDTAVAGTAHEPDSRSAQRATTQTDSRASASLAAATATTMSQAERGRAVARPVAQAPKGAQYAAAAMDTDFTVSDIEAAMATVRTVSPPRDEQRANPFEDSDFAPLDGTTMPSPYTRPLTQPPTQPPTQPSTQSSVATRIGKVGQRDVDDLGDFVDLDIPPLAAGGTVLPLTGRAAPPPTTPVETAVAPEMLLGDAHPFDFKLDIPTAFDPLATDSLKTTIVDRPDTFDVPPNMPAELDFELPSATAIEASNAASESEAMPDRHGATALDDLFAPLGEPGPNTILDLDDRRAAPPGTTEVDRMIVTAVDDAADATANETTRTRLTRFADLMKQVDEAAGGDPLRAIAHLRQYVLRDEHIPTLLWLRLFELYKTVDKKPVYEALSEHFARRYRRPMIAWDEDLKDRVPQTPLASMGTIDREVEALWGREAGLERLRSLLCDRDQDDAVVFNAALQRDLLDAARIFPR